MSKATKKVLILVAHRPDRSPSQRFRYEQYLPFLEENGYEFEYSYLISEQDDQFFYKSGNYFKKFLFLIRATGKRLKDVKRSKDFDLVFIQREAFLLGTTYFERKIFKTGIPIIYDFDDAIWEINKEGGNKALNFLKNPDKTSELIKLSKAVIVGNSYLADYAKNYNQRVSIIPTTIDLDYHSTTKLNSEIVIGWTGTFSTYPYFLELLPVLQKVKQKYPFVKFQIIVDLDLEISELDSHTTVWDREEEINQLRKISIGIMPLPDNRWTKGKCGFKGLQYMSLGIPTLMSPVGVNAEIIEDGVNGFLPTTSDEWFLRLSQLVENEELRKALGEKGFSTVKKSYSVEGNKEKYLKLFEKVTSHIYN